MKILVYIILFAGSLFTGCKDKDDNLNASFGEWEWVQSVGGDAGLTLTPSTEDITRHLEIDANTYKEFENDSLIFESTYDIETRPYSFFGSNVFLVFPGGAALSIIREGDELELSEYSLHGYSHTYVRK